MTGHFYPRMTEDSVSPAELRAMDGSPQHGRLMAKRQVLGDQGCPVGEERLEERQDELDNDHRRNRRHGC
jgi:hypothetical protein